MNAAVLVLLLIGAQCVLSDLPLVRDTPCQIQQWPYLQDAYEWRDGKTHQKIGLEEKPGLVKIADLFTEIRRGLTGMDAAALCKLEAEGATIEAIWFDQADEVENTDTYVFGLGEGVKDKIMFGMRGKDQEYRPRARYQLYGLITSQNPKFTVSCGFGRYGDKCPSGDLDANVFPRLQADEAK